MADPLARCVFCPRLCRHVCPVALATDLEAATPTALATAAWLGCSGRLDPMLAWRLASLCTACGACRVHCLHHVPLPDLLAEARRRLRPVPEPPETPAPAEGTGAWAAVVCDGRDWAGALAMRLGEPVARWVTSDHAGESLRDHPAALARHATRLREALGDRRPVVACGRCQETLAVAGLDPVPLHRLVSPGWPGLGCEHPDHPPIEAGTACCAGAHGPLARVHPDLAARVAVEAARVRGSEPVRTADAALRALLLRAGARARDLVDDLLDPDGSLP